MLATLKLVAVLAVIAYVAILVLMYVMQGRLLYPSARVVERLPSSNELAEFGLVAWPEADPVGLVTSPDSARATVVVFHGNGGTALQRGYYVEALRARGLRVVLAEYPAYGWRSGAASALRQLDVPVEAVVLLTPWDTLPNTASAAYPWLPVRWLLRDPYDSVENLSGFEGRVAVLVAENDEVIPAPRGLALYEGLNAEKRLWTFSGAGHNSWPSQPDASWWDEVLAFALSDA